MIRERACTPSAAPTPVPEPLAIKSHDDGKDHVLSTSNITRTTSLAARFALSTTRLATRNSPDSSGLRRLPSRTLVRQTSRRWSPRPSYTKRLDNLHEVLHGRVVNMTSSPKNFLLVSLALHAPAFAKRKFYLCLLFFLCKKCLIAVLIFGLLYVRLIPTTGYWTLPPGSSSESDQRAVPLL